MVSLKDLLENEAARDTAAAQMEAMNEAPAPDESGEEGIQSATDLEEIFRELANNTVAINFAKW